MEKQQDAIQRFLKGTDSPLNKLEEKFLEMAQDLRANGRVPEDDLKEICRILRALNTAASEAGLKKIAGLTQHWEELLRHAWEHSVVFDRKLADLFGSALEALEHLVSGLRLQGQESADITILLEDIKAFTQKDSDKNKKSISATGIDETYLGVYLDETEQNIASFNHDLLVLEKNPVEPTLINNLFRVIHTVKGSSAMMNMAEVQEIAHEMENILVIARENQRASPEMFPLLFFGIDVISRIVFSLRHKTAATTDTVSLIEKLKSYAKSDQKENKKNPPAKTATSLASFIRIDTQKLDTLMNLSGELVIIRAQYEGLVKQLRQEVSREKEFAQVLTALKSNFLALLRELDECIGTKPDPQTKYILKEAENLRVYLERLQEAAGQSRLATGLRRIDETTSVLGKTASYIQSTVMQARMVPIGGVFSRFNRIVRDIAKELGKDVSFVLEGAETELDRNLSDGIAEPLIHMVRNAISHGIEDTDTRAKAGKPARGTITLRAFHQGNNVYIEVEDDGRGINPQLLAENALQKKLVTETQVSRMTDKEKMDLIFLPGFSTASQVTGISGRGVGMNAVRSMLSAIHGTIDAHSVIGEKTTFILKIPLTLAIIKALLIAVGDDVYALPLESVKEIMSVTEEMIIRNNGQFNIKLREQLRLRELKDVLHSRLTSQKVNNIKRVVIVADSTGEAGILVDQLIQETEVVIKPLPRHFAHVKGITGVTILGDGRLALILDPKIILAK